MLLLHAPTGAGKTRAVLDLARGGQGVLLTVPTNALAAEVEETYSRAPFSGKVRRWNADAFASQGHERHEEMILQAWEADLVVANPDLLHLFTQHEYRRKDSRTRTSAFGMKNLRLLVFDEYHAYDERVLAALLLLVLKGRAARDNDQRYVFMTATPDEGLAQALKHLGIPHEEAPMEPVSPVPLPESEGRRIKGEIQVEITTDPLRRSLPERPPEGRTLFIFSTFLEQQGAVRALQKRGFREGDTPGGFVQITGRKTSSDRGQDSWNEARILLATSKVEVGLNIDDLDSVALEPGWADQQFWQRFGRAGRGRDARVRLHFDGYDERVLAGLRKATDYDTLARAIRALLQTERTHVDTLLRFVGAYGASYHENTPPSHDAKLFDPESLPGQTRTGYGLVQKMMRTWEEDELRDEPGGAGDWMERVRYALRGLRGRSLRVPTEYAWTPGEIVHEDVVYVLCRTDAPEPDRSRVHRVREIFPEPKDALLHYEILDGVDVEVPIRGRIRFQDFRRVPSQIDRAIRRETGGDLPPFWDALVRWLSVVPPDEIPPAEVTLDDRFL